MTNLKNTLRKIDVNSFKNTTQKVAYRLLSASGKWMSRSEITNRHVGSVASRIRDLRTEQFGSFNVECIRGKEIGKPVRNNVFYYRIQPRTVTPQQLSKVFEI